MNDFLTKARAMRSVLKKTRGPADLPTPILYVEWLSGSRLRRVLDTKGVEHKLADAVVQSNYKLVTGSQAKDLIAEHWVGVAAEGAEA